MLQLLAECCVFHLPELTVMLLLLLLLFFLF
jgi:hypothetical protein